MMSSGQTETLLAMAADLQEATRLEEVAKVFFRTVSAADAGVTALLELKGAWGQRRVLSPRGKKPAPASNCHGLAWRVETAGARLDILLWRPDASFETDPRGFWAELRHQVEPAFVRACEYERMLDENRLLRKEFAQRGSAVLLSSDNGRLLPPSPEARAMIERHDPAGADWQPLLERIQGHLPPAGGKTREVGEVQTTAGILQFRARSIPGGGFRVLYIKEAQRFLPPEQFARLGLSPRQTEVLHWLTEGKTNPEIALILGIGTETVKHHVCSLFDHFGVRSRQDLSRKIEEMDRVSSRK